METIRGCWSYKELERQINSLYYERSGLSRNKEALSALVQQQAAPLQPKDVINTPVTLEFLGLNERVLVTESDLEQSILDNLQRFLLEMGHGFCFEAALHRKGRYNGEVRHRRIRPQHLCAEIHDRTSKRGRNQAVYFGRNLLGCPALP